MTTKVNIQDGGRRVLDLEVGFISGQNSVSMCTIAKFRVFGNSVGEELMTLAKFILLHNNNNIIRVQHLYSAMESGDTEALENQQMGALKLQVMDFGSKEG